MKINIKQKTLELFDQYRQAGNEDERIGLQNEIIELNKFLIPGCIRRFFRHYKMTAEYHDFYNICIIGVILGIKDYAKKKPTCSFATCAEHHMINKMKLFYLDTLPVSVSIQIFELKNKLEKNKLPFTKTQARTMEFMTDEKKNRMFNAFSNAIEYKPAWIALNKNQEKKEDHTDVKKIVENKLKILLQKKKITESNAFYFREYFFNNQDEKTSFGTIAKKYNVKHYQGVQQHVMRVIRLLRLDQKFKKDLQELLH